MMPFQPMNFANIPLVRMPDVVGSLAQGYQAGLLPEMEKREQQKEIRAENADARAAEAEKLANAFKQMQMQAMPQEQSLNFDLMRAQSEKARSDVEMQKMQAERMKAFTNLLSGAQPSSAGQPFMQEGAPQQIAQPAQDAGMAQKLQDIKQLQKDSARPNEVVIEQGNPNASHLDYLYESNPQFRSEFEKAGFKKSVQIKQDPQTGQLFESIKYPSGRVTARAVQLGVDPVTLAGDKERAKENVKADMKIANDATKSLLDVDRTLTNIGIIRDTFNRNQNLMNVVGPVQSVLAKWTGNEQDRRTLGDVGSTLGNVVLDASKVISGAFTGRDQTLIESIKPSKSDFPGVFMGKLESMEKIANIVQKRNGLIAEYIRQGAPAHKAIQQAQKETDLIKISSDVRQRIKRDEQLSKFVTPQEMMQLNSIGSEEEMFAYLSKLPAEKRNKILAAYGA